LNDLNPTPSILQTKFDEYHISTKSGIFGQALPSSILEAKLLPKDLVDNIITLAGKSLGDKINDVKIVDNSFAGSDSNKVFDSAKKAGEENFVRKLSLVEQPDGKLRPIAIYDYFSQCALKPLHTHIFNVLGALSTDATFNQDITKDPYIFKQKYYSSYDMTQCTDRLPCDSQM